MKHACPLVFVAVVGLVLLSSSAWAGGRGHRGGVVVVAPHGSAVIASPSLVVVRPGPRVFVAPTSSVFATVVAPHQVFPRFGAAVIVTRPFFPFVVSAPSVIVSSPPVVYAQPPPVVSVAPSPLPMPTLIEYPTGWYQLRGDGVTTPYVWVWIPKPPPPPPTEAPPAVTPPGPSAPPAPPGPRGSKEQPSRASSGRVYRWTDAQGVTHWTDRLDTVPVRYRAGASMPTSAGG